MSNKRKMWPLEQKPKVLEEARMSGATIAEVCRRHGITTSQYYQWERVSEEGSSPEDIVARRIPRLPVLNLLRRTGIRYSSLCHPSIMIFGLTQGMRTAHISASAPSTRLSRRFAKSWPPC